MNVVVIMAVAHEEDEQDLNHVHGVYNSLELFYNECIERGRIMSTCDEDNHYYDRNFYYIEKVHYVQGTTEGVQK